MRFLFADVELVTVAFSLTRLTVVAGNRQAIS